MTEELTTPLCACGCNRHVSRPANTYLKGHHHRIPERLHYTASESGCWLWNLTKSTSGYGSLSGRLAHRLYYAKYRGPIAPGCHIHHLCHQKLCVNPEHLEELSAAKHASKRRTNKLSDALVSQIRALVKEQLAEVAEQLGISKDYLKRVWAGDFWKSVAPESAEAMSPTNY